MRVLEPTEVVSAMTIRTNATKPLLAVTCNRRPRRCQGAGL